MIPGIVASHQVGAPAAPVKWDTATQSGTISLTNSDLTTQSSTSGAWRSIRANKGVAAGKFYWEVEIDSGTPNNILMGVATSALNQNLYPGSDATSYGFQPSGGGPLKWTSGGSAGYGSNLAVGDTLCVALDMDNGRVFFGKNGTWMDSGDPAAGSNPSFSGLAGTQFPAVAHFDATTVLSAWFKSSQWDFAAPSGFGQLVI